MFRLLLNPAAEAAGGAAATTTAATTTTATTTGAAPAAEPPKTDPNKALLAELAALQARVGDFETRERERKAVEDKAVEDKAKERGEFDKILKERDDRIAAERAKTETSDRRAANYARDRELTVVLSGYDLVHGKAAAQLLELWKNDFEAVPEGDGFAVRSKDRRPVAEVVKERLASPDYENFIRSAARPGGGPANSTTTPTPDPTKGQPRSFEEAVAEQMKSQPRGNFRAPVTSQAPLNGYRTQTF